MIDKWLKAGVLEDGQLFYPESGTPEGGVISPILANVFLHYVLDEWFAEQVQPRLRGPSTLVRYCDDFVMLFVRKAHAERVLAVLGKRLEKYGLQLHPDKTRLVDFRSPGPNERAGDGSTLATSFNFLGFCHVWGRSRKGYAVVRQLTAKDRFARTLKAVAEQCRRIRHWSLADQHRRLSQMLRGHFAYFGISGNYARLRDLHYQVRRCWRYWLSRRSRQGLPWSAFARIDARFPLPPPVIVHR